MKTAATSTVVGTTADSTTKSQTKRKTGVRGMRSKYTLTRQPAGELGAEHGSHGSRHRSGQHGQHHSKAPQQGTTNRTPQPAAHPLTDKHGELSAENYGHCS